MQWAILSFLILIAAYLLYWWGAKPIHYRHQTPKDIRHFTEAFFAQGGDGALLFVHHEGSERFVQFAKYLVPKRMVHFGFPEVAWSQPHYSSVHAALTGAGFACVQQQGSDGTRFLCIDDINSAEHAAEIALAAFTAMGLGMDARYTIHQAGPVSLGEWKRNAPNWKKFTKKRDA